MAEEPVESRSGITNQEVFEEAAKNSGRQLVNDLENKGFKPDQISSILSSIDHHGAGSTMFDSPNHPTIMGTNAEQNHDVMEQIGKWVSQVVISGRASLR